MQIIRKIKQFFAINFTFKKISFVFIKLFLFLLVFVIAVPVNIILVINNYYKDFIITDLDTVPQTRVAIVFGAGLSEDGTKPSSVLNDRVLAAVDLYKAGKINKIIMSGDNRYENYNEPQVMINVAKENGVSSFDLQADFAGRRTYDTCYRAKYIFGVENAILITQDFHLVRALYTCSNLGINSIGYPANKNSYVDENIFAFRDIAATLLAYWEINVAPPNVVLGEKINF